MDTNVTKANNSCVKCQITSGGLFTCHGCHRSFCWKHIDEHKSDLSLQMDLVAQEHDSLQEDSKRLSTRHPLLADIDRWEEESIVKIRTVADETRRDVEKQIQGFQNTMQTSCAKITNEIRSSRQSDNFISEVNIASWTETLKQMRQQLQTTATIRLSNDEDVPLIQMIKIKQETPVISNRPNLKRKLSSITVDNLLTFIESTSPTLTREQFNYIIDFAEELWDCHIDGVAAQLKFISLLNSIGQRCQHDLAARVLEILWNLAHDNRLNEVIQQRIFKSHCLILNQERSPHNELKREYCSRCVKHLQQKQDYTISAIRYLIEILSSTHTTTVVERSNFDIIQVLVVKHDIINILIQNIFACQLVTQDKGKTSTKHITLIHGRCTNEDAIEIHLDLLSVLLKKGDLYLIYKRCEELWDILISNGKASSTERELGFNWFVNCQVDLNRETRITLFENRVSKLDVTKLSAKGQECFKLYFDQYENKSK
ncbi:unnamed protein product [Adineta ricciae]|uniref:UBP34/UBP24/USP9X/USP9Y-like ARM repeat region domain-containing protein n=1 Tax=Adineta ricciae TaxID=249248 RepID=A0A814U7Z8_ADIRI|nr:unnamed protein product [Adineta ricciae]CAF1385715.1 unnamed protein product [Adineta ricciae]